jgi:UDP-glucose 4-epimerase
VTPVNTFRGRHVVMTGGGDYVGSRVLERLVDGGAHVVLVGPNIGTSPRTAELVSEGRVRFKMTASTEDRSSLREAFGGDDHLVLLGYTPPAGISPGARLAQEFALNVEPNIRLIDAGGDRLAHVMFASSVAVYGQQPALPAAESAALVPVAPLAVAMVTAERALRSAGSYRGVPCAILRFATVYGPDDDTPESVSRLIDTAVAGSDIALGADAQDELDYVHLDDAVEATIRAIALRADGIFNVGTGRATSKLEVARLVLAAAGTGAVHQRAPAGRPTTFRCDPEHAAQELGFRARRDLPSSIAAEVARIRAQPATVAALLPANSGATA